MTIKGKYLVTTDGWFFAPDGQEYRCVWGEVEAVGDDVLGIKTNSRSANWFLKVGSNDRHVIIAGCQIHYAIKCNTQPVLHSYIKEGMHEGKLTKSECPSRIYIAE